MMVLAKFRQRYPQGSLVSELIYIDRGTYIVRASAIVENVTLATGFAGGERVEVAEDKARERAISALNLEVNIASSSPHSIPSSNGKDKTATNSIPNTSSPAIAKSPSTNYVKNYEEVSSKLETPNGGVISQPVALPPEREPVVPQNTSESAPEELSSEPTEPRNLFEGTYNTATVAQDIAPETNNIESSSETIDSPSEEMAVVIEDIHQIIHQTDVEVKRLGWTKNDGKEFLKSRYGKYSRISLTDEQLLEFLEYLKSQPTPT